MNLIITICLIAVVVVFLLINRTPNKIEDPILDEVSPRLMQRLTNGKINVFTYCNHRDYNFKMSWRYPQLKLTYSRPFEYLCIQSLIHNMGRYDVNIIVLNSRNVHSYLPDFPLTFSNDVSTKKTMDLLGAYILDRYGGIWISPFTVVMNKDLSKYFDRLTAKPGTMVTVDDGRQIPAYGEIFTVGTSSNVAGIHHRNSRIVNNKIIGARRNSQIIRNYKNILEKNIIGRSSLNFNALNRTQNNIEPLTDAITSITKGLGHHSFGEKRDGTVNINLRRIHIDEYFGKMPLQFLDPSRVDFISIPYEELETDTTYMWIHSTPVKEMIQNNIAIVEILKRQL
jgi:hypothetical protein